MINDHLSISSHGLQLLQAVETLRLSPYDDQTGEPITEWCQGATIGYGHLIAEYDWQRFKYGIQPGQAVDLLSDDLQSFEAIIRKAIIAPLAQQQFDALAILAFNIGASKFRSSSAVRLINDPRAVTPYVSLESAWKAWNRSQGKINDGLINRRNCEWNVWRLGVYERW
jgi:GH24 family phage-related lysozyme (muramidase)